VSARFSQEDYKFLLSENESSVSDALRRAVQFQRESEKFEQLVRKNIAAEIGKIRAENDGMKDEIRRIVAEAAADMLAEMHKENAGITQHIDASTQKIGNALLQLFKKYFPGKG
tara:strand:+ start:5738 stop:6079 length:342 start_codon:yes stop_codon:yes gene_type:complete